MIASIWDWDARLVRRYPDAAYRYMEAMVAELRVLLREPSPEPSSAEIEAAEAAWSAAARHRTSAIPFRQALLAAASVRKRERQHHD